MTFIKYQGFYKTDGTDTFTKSGKTKQEDLNYLI